MTIADYEALLNEARVVLERYMFDGVDLRDALRPTTDSNRPRALQGIARTA